MRRRAMMELAAIGQERERQEGVWCDGGYYTSLANGIAFAGDRSIEVYFSYSKAPQAYAVVFTTQGAVTAPLNTRQIVVAIDRAVTENLRISGCNMLGSKTVSPGNMYHVVVILSNGELSAYLNGVKIAMEDRGHVYVSPGRLYVGSDSFYNFGGKIEFLRLFSYPLTASEVATLYNGGKPAEYVVPQTYKNHSNVVFPVDRYTPSNYVFSSNVGTATRNLFNQPQANGFSGDFMRFEAITQISLYCHYWHIQAAKRAPIRITFEYRSNIAIYGENTLTHKVAEPNEGEPLIASVEYGAGTSSFLGSTRSTTAWLEMRVLSIEPLGCVAEYLPQNLLPTRKRDFPQVVFPVDRYTPSYYVFSSNAGTVTLDLFNQPQANGFSGDFMRFEAITQISLYCHYWHRYTAKLAPIRITFEYRSNISIYASQISASPTAADAVIVAEPNEGVPLIATVEYGAGTSSFLGSTRSTTAWLEMRVLSIDVIEGVAQAWLDSSKQLPANEEYLPPLFQGIGGYDLTATGSPKVITK